MRHHLSVFATALIFAVLAAGPVLAQPAATLIHLPAFPQAGLVAAPGGEVLLAGLAATPADLECGEGATAWPCGAMARAAVQRFVRRRAVECRAASESVAPGRATCTVAGSDIGGWLVAQGWAKAEGDVYRDEEAAAREAERGLWAQSRPRLMPAGLPSGPLPEIPEDAAVLAEVSLSTQSLRLVHNGALVGTWPVSTARYGKVTPVGTYRAQWLARHHRSSLYDGAPMPFSVFFHGDYAVHGTYETGRLGRPASAGCVRLSPEHARVLFELALAEGPARTVVVVRP